MVGRPKKSGSIPKKAPIRKNKVRTLETRGITYKEPAFIGSFWRDHTMDQIQEMTDEEVMQAVDIFLDKLIARAIKNDKNWNFPILDAYLRIASLPKK
jgi:hypothetical protein